MSDDALLQALRRGERPEGVEILKDNPVRIVVRTGDRVLKVFRRASRGPRLEARALVRARERGVPAPELLGHGRDWIATRFLEGRAATRDDLDRMLPLISRAHAAGLLHGDLHVGNVWMTADGPVLIDLQKARFLPWLPGVLRKRELGAFAYSLGEPLPAALEHVGGWCRRRAHAHWRSRTRRCVKESSGFTPFRTGDLLGFRRRETDPDALERSLAAVDESKLIWPARSASRVYRSDGFVLKRHRNARSARSAWICGHGLEVRGVATGRAVAWAGAWLWMEDAGPSVVDWANANFESASAGTREEMLCALVDAMVTMHRRGVYHRDLKTWNFAWQPGQRARVLDYERVDFGRSVSLRRRTKNLAQLNAELPLVVPSELRARGLRRYVEALGASDPIDALRREVVSQSVARNPSWTPEECGHV